MAVELASAYVSIIPSARGLGTSLRRELSGPLEAEANNVGDRAGRNFSNRFVAGVGTAATRGALALTAGFTLAAGAGIKIAADFEQTQIAFEGILGSAEEATAVLGDLRDFAAKTPFEFTGLTDSAKTLLGVGFAAEDLIPTMTQLGNVAATLGVGATEINGVVRALGQIKGKGKVSAEELQQISEQIPGFSAIGAIAKGLGVTVPQAFDRISKGLVPADEGIAAILAGMEDFPGAAGAMERQSKTLNGVISTFKDTLATTAIDFITPYLPAISAGVASLGRFIQTDAVPAIEGFISLITDDIAPAVRGFIDLFEAEGLSGVLTRFGELIQEAIVTQGPVVLRALGDLLGVIGTWVTTEGIPLLGDTMRELGPAMIEWILNDAIPGIVKNLPGIVAAIAEFVATKALPALAGLGVDMAASIIGGMVEVLKAGGKFALEIAKAIGNALISLINDVVIDGLNESLEFELKIRGVGFSVDAPDIPHIPKFDLGGVVPGPRGSAQLVLAHGGETILPTHRGDFDLSERQPDSTAPFVGGNLIVQQLPGEDAGEAVYRTHRKIRLMAAV